MSLQVNCDSPSFHRFRRIDMLLIVCYMAIPPAWLVILFRNRTKLNPTTDDPRLAIFLRNSDPDLSSLRFLFAAYRPHFFFWEAIEM